MGALVLAAPFVVALIAYWLWGRPSKLERVDTEDKAKDVWRPE